MSNRRQISIAVIGAGSWGTAIGAWLARNGHDVRIWDIDQAVIEDIDGSHMNSRYLPGCELPANLIGCHTLGTALSNCTMVVLAVPSRVFEIVLENLTSEFHRLNLSERPVVVWGTKGFSENNCTLLSSVADRVLQEKAETAVISGPSFAIEVAKGLPVGLDLGSASAKREQIADVFRSENALVYTTEDVVGVQVGGVTKNVIAIAAGVADGLGLGINARSLLITRGHAEMNRLNLALGGESKTMMGLSGLGDLILTCSGDLSRNRRLGLGLGRGVPLEEVINDIGQEIQGISSTRNTYQLAQQLDVFMPITERVYRILFEGLAPLQAVKELLTVGPSLK